MEIKAMTLITKTERERLKYSEKSIMGKYEATLAEALRVLRNARDLFDDRFGEEEAAMSHEITSLLETVDGE